MKKLLAVLLVGLLVLTGCSTNNGGDDATEKLVIYGLDGGYGTEGWEKVVEAFKEETGIDVELVLEKNIAEVLRPKFQADEAPDLVYLGVGSEGGVTDTLITENALVAIDDVLDLEIPGEGVKLKDKIQTELFDTKRVRPYADNNLYLAPVFYTPLGMYHNKALFTEKGWDIPTTWDEMLALGETAKAEGIALFTYPTAGYFDGFVAALLNTVVGDDAFLKLMNYDLDTWKSPETKKAFELVGELVQYTHENTVSQANGEGFTKNQQLILDNEALFIPNGGWLPNEMAEAPKADGFEWGVAPVPALNAGDARYAGMFTEEVYIPQGAKNVENAKKFLAFMYSDVAVELYAATGANQPVKNITDFLDETNAIGMSVLTEGVKTTVVGFASPKNVVEGVNIGAVLFDNIDALMIGDKTVDVWYDEVVDAIAKFN